MTTTATRPETVPSTWTAADETFFRVVAEVLPPAFLMGAGVLLASYDDEAASPVAPTAPARAVAHPGAAVAA